MKPVSSQCSHQLELASGCDTQQVPWNDGRRCLSTGSHPFEGERRKGGRGRGKKIRLPVIIALLENSVRWQIELLIGAA